MAVFMPLEENPYIVPHLKTFISGQWAEVWQYSRLVNALLKISILLDNMASDPFSILLIVRQIYSNFKVIAKLLQ